jgi:hypothetical protein
MPVRHNQNIYRHRRHRDGGGYWNVIRRRLATGIRSDGVKQERKKERKKEKKGEGLQLTFY